MDALDAARALLPAWVRLGAGLGMLPFALALGWLTTRAACAAALPRRRTWDGDGEGMHWAERARVTWPARQVGALAPLLAAGVLGGAAAGGLGPFAALPAWAVAAAVGLGAWLGGLSAAAGVSARTTGERLGVRGLAWAYLGGLLLFAPALLGVAAMLALVHAEWSAATAAGVVLGVAGIALAGVWSGLPLLRVLGRLRPPGPRLRAALERAAARTGVAPRAVWELDLPLANAAALPVPRWLVFTRRAVDALDDAGLEAVACHELGHVDEPRGVVWLRVAGGFALLPVGFAGLLVQAFGPLLGVAAVYGLVLAVALPVARVRRRMEERADHVAHAHEAAAGSYARGLEALYRANAMPAVGLGRRGVHPHLYDRLLAAGAEPDFPRPERPSAWRLGAGLAVACAVLVAGVPWLLATRPLLAATGLPAETRVALGVLVDGGRTLDLHALALERDAAGRPDEAAAAVRGLLALQPGRWDYRAWHAGLAARLRRCDAARTDLALARAGYEASFAPGGDEPHAVEDHPWILSAEGLLRAHCTPARLATRD